MLGFRNFIIYWIAFTIIVKTAFLTGAIFIWRTQDDYVKWLVIGWWSDDVVLDK